MSEKLHHVKYVRQCGRYLTGDITAYGREDADQLISQGVVVPYSPPKGEDASDDGEDGPVAEKSDKDTGSRRRVRAETRQVG